MFRGCKREPLFQYFTVQSDERFNLRASPGPYCAKPVFMCFAFKSNAASSPERTLHFPVSSYAPHDGVIRQRVESYAADISSTLLTKYRRCVDTLHSRPLTHGRGLNSYVSLKNARSGPVTTFYVSEELFNILPLLPD